MSCSSQIHNFEFKMEDIEKAVKSGRLLSMEIEVTLKCNFRCPYCYVPNKEAPENELSLDEIKDVILQARDLGVEKIILLGGEPAIHPNILTIIRFIRNHALEVEIFTNGSMVTEDFAEELYKNRVRVVLKMNTFDEKLQDVLTGQKGSFKVIQKAFSNLRQAGYPSKQAFLAVSTIICRQNLDEIPKIWRWLRDRNIAPYFEIITPQENALTNEWLNVRPEKIKDVFYLISEIDRKEYGYIWDPQPPLMGNRCMRHQFSCLVTSRGDVMPCVGINIPVGSIRKKRLADIIKDSEVLKNLKNYKQTIKGPCGVCEKADTCYGCRGAAFQMTGDYLASDPLCWKNIDKTDKIVSLPCPVNGLIPQKPPMRVVDNILTIGERTAEVSVTIVEDMPFIGPDGVVDETVYLEMMAQAIAAFNGFINAGRTSCSHEGLLLGAKKLTISGQSKVGDRLNISVFKQARYGDFGIIKGIITREDEVVADGEIKIWHKS